MGQPRPRSGAFAVVYKGTDPNTDQNFAVRVFNSECPERRDRYELICEYLRNRKVRSLVNFEYQETGIRSTNGKWYPLIVMDWVEGDTLFDWLSLCASRCDTPAIERVAGNWLAVVQELGEVRVVHGDLQHANVLVMTDGTLKLVDYDGIGVPGLVGRRNLEIGVEPYQHPDRTGATILSPSLDNFSAILIYTALRAVASDPRLWCIHVERSSYEKLLFRKSDFEAPDASPLFKDLRESKDAKVRELADRLIAYRLGPLDAVPRLSEVAMAPPRIIMVPASRLDRLGVTTEAQERQGSPSLGVGQDSPTEDGTDSQSCARVGRAAASDAAGKPAERSEKFALALVVGGLVLLFLIPVLLSFITWLTRATERSGIQRDGQPPIARADGDRGAKEEVEKKAVREPEPPQLQKANSLIQAPGRDSRRKFVEAAAEFSAQTLRKYGWKINANYRDELLQKLQPLTDRDCSQEEFENAAKLQSQLFHNKGLALYRLGEFDEAIKYFTFAIAFDPSLAGAYRIRADAHVRKDALSWAILDYTKCTELSPVGAGAYNERGIAYWRLGQIDKAIGDFQRALELDPNDAYARANLMGVELDRSSPPRGAKSR